MSESKPTIAGFSVVSDQESPIRVAVIGTGHLGRIHARLLSQVAGAKLVAVCDVNEDACQAVASEHDVLAFQDVSSCLDQIDAAVVAAPTGCHPSIATTLIQAGKHVLVEKPLAATADDATRLALRARTRNVVLQVGHVERFNPAFTALGEFGVDVKYAEATRASRFPGRCLDVGVVMDLMIHDLDLVLSLTESPVKSIAASGVSVVSKHEDIAEARLEFECGLIANLKASRISPTPARDMMLASPAGFAQIDFGTPSLTTVATSQSILNRSFELNQETDNPLSYGDTLFEEHLPVATASLEPRNAILDELHDFVVSIQSSSQPIVSGAAGARAVTIAENILDAIDQRAWYSYASELEQGPHAEVRRRIEQHRRAA
ncbi:MAG: Gfo/Idh/MocA family oxidoreductase [Planctomycetota bacterium]